MKTEFSLKKALAKQARSKKPYYLQRLVVTKLAIFLTKLKVL